MFIFHSLNFNFLIHFMPSIISVHFAAGVEVPLLDGFFDPQSYSFWHLAAMEAGRIMPWWSWTLPAHVKEMNT